MLLREAAALLPPPKVLRDRCIAVAALDLIVRVEGEHAYFSYQPTFGPDGAWSLASMDDGHGDSFAIAFGPKATVIRGYDHELTRRAAVVTADLPADLRWLLDDPSLEEGPEDVSCCFWHLGGPRGVWRCTDTEAVNDGGFEWMFAELIDGTPDGFRRFAQHFYEVELGDIVEEVFALRPVNAFMVRATNREADVLRVLKALDAMAYPIVRP